MLCESAEPSSTTHYYKLAIRIAVGSIKGIPKPSIGGSGGGTATWAVVNAGKGNYAHTDASRIAAWGTELRRGRKLCELERQSNFLDLGSSTPGCSVKHTPRTQRGRLRNRFSSFWVEWAIGVGECKGSGTVRYGEFWKRD